MAAEEEVADLWLCNACGLLPRTSFHESNLKKALHKCRRCTTEKNRLYHAANRDVLKMRRHVPLKGVLRRADITGVLELHQRKCFITGLSGNLQLVKADPDGPLEMSNLVPILSKLARCLKALPADCFRRWLAEKLKREARGDTGAQKPARDVAQQLDPSAVEACCLRVVAPGPSATDRGFQLDAPGEPAGGADATAEMMPLPPAVGLQTAAALPTASPREETKEDDIAAIPAAERLRRLQQAKKSSPAHPPNGLRKKSAVA